MGKKYKLKKKHSVSSFIILFVLVVSLFVMNTGYSLWSSKLNIYGKVTLNYTPPPLEVSISSTGKDTYTNMGGLTQTLLRMFDFESDVLDGNSLTSTIRVHKNLNMAWFNGNISIKFTIKNSSEEGYIYTNGKVTQMEVANPGGLISNVSADVLPKIISSGQTADFNFSASVNRANLRSETYYKYAITYDVNGVTQYFFYTIRILPQ